MTVSRPTRIRISRLFFLMSALFLIAGTVVGVTSLTGRQENANASAEVNGTFTVGSESYAVSEGGSVNVTILRSGGLAGNVRVQWALSGGTATSNVDFAAASGYVTFFPDETSKTILVHTSEDADVEPNETFTFTITGFLVSGSLYPAGGIGTPSEATILIVDDDGQATYSFLESTANVNEAAGTISITVIRSGDHTGTDTVECAPTGGTATFGTDFVFAPNPKTVTFNPGYVFRSCSLSITQDSVLDPGETIILSLANPTGFAGGAGDEPDQTITIVDDDVPSIQWSSATFSTLEGASGTHTVTISATRTGDLTGSASVDWTTAGGGSASSATDYTAASGTFSWANGVGGTKYAYITIKGDTNIEADETVNLDLYNVSNATLGEPSSAVLTILNDDSSGTFVFDTDTHVQLEGAVTHTITVYRTGSTSGSATVDYYSSGGTATAGADYEAVSGTLTFNAGVSSRSFTVTVYNDALIEGAETVNFYLANPSGGTTLGTPYVTHLTIYDDEAGPPVVTSLSPSLGPTTGGNTVYLTGLNFLGVTDVRFGAYSAVFTVTSATTITAIAPVYGYAGTVQVVVEHPLLGISSTAGTGNDYLYYVVTTPDLPVVTSVYPASGSAGTQVTVSGAHFTGVTGVTIGGVATNYTVNNSGQITVTVPSGISPATVHIRVTTSQGTSPSTAADDFTVTAAVFPPTFTYNLTFRWSLISWNGADNASISNAVRGVETGTDNPATTNVSGYITAIWFWDGAAQAFRGYFVGSEGIPGANDFTTFRHGAVYWVASNASIPWTVVQSQ